MNKLELAEIGIKYVKEFCDLNKISYPKFVIDKNTFQEDCCGGYGNKTIYVYIKACSNEFDIPGYGWSHRHYFVDREPCGVIAHEFGHYIHDIMTNKELVLPSENVLITNYEIVNHHERFAETFKLFLLNPNLLKEFAPQRYKVLIEKLKLKPIFTETWMELMEKNNMHPKHIKAAQNKLKNAIKARKIDVPRLF